MFRIDVGGEVRPGIFEYSCSGMPAVAGRSHQPLLDACRQIKRMGGDTAQLAGLFRDGKSDPDLFCSVARGADHTVSEPASGANGPRFARWKPFVR